MSAASAVACVVSACVGWAVGCGCACCGLGDDGGLLLLLSLLPPPRASGIRVSVSL